MKRKLHNYQVELLQRLQATPIEAGVITYAEVQHDSWCGFFLGGLCDCSPNVHLSMPKYDDLEDY